MSRAQRQRRIVELLGEREVRSQAELSDLLAGEGVEVTQATLSRDLVEIGAVKVRRDGTLVYVVPPPGSEARPSDGMGEGASGRLRRACEELLVGAQAANNLVVVRTPPGAANYLALLIDQARDAEVLGTLAGDDTIMIVASTPEAALTVAEHLSRLAGSRD